MSHHTDSADYPMLDTEQQALAAVGETVDLREVATQVLAERSAWGNVGAAIKDLRRTKKLQAEAATSKAEIDALFPIEWPGETGEK